MADQKFDGYSKNDLSKKLVDGETGGVTFKNLKPATDYDFVVTYAGENPTKSGTDLGKVTTSSATSPASSASGGSSAGSSASSSANPASSAASSASSSASSASSAATPASSASKK